MTELEKKAHLLRRFGLGAGTAELARYPGDSKATLETLLNDDKAKDGFAIDPWQLFLNAEGKVDTGSYHLGPWWALRMVLTQTPMTEKLTLFWHDHFALDGEKVAEGPTMLAYLDVLRTKGRGKFRDLIQAVMTEGAMLTFLDGHTSHRTRPNENLARETFELFTMGEGSGYTERDVKELARALTGWTMHYMGSYLDEPYERTKKRADDAHMAMNNFCFVPALHDAGHKTILGKSAAFTGESALEWLCDQPQTAKYICGKLWFFFSGHPAPESVLAKLTASWKKTDGEIRAVLRSITDQPEFWADRSLPKSPVDWCISPFRAMDLGPSLMAKHKPFDPFTPKELEKELVDVANNAYYQMQQQGLALLFPPNVAGWNWGQGWIGADISVKRFRSVDAFFWTGGDSRPYAVQTASLLKERKDSAAIVDSFLSLIDAEITAEQKAPLIAICDKFGGPKALENKDLTAGLFATMSKILFAIPTYQLC